MQFAGQRTDLDLKPLQEPHDYFIKLTEDILPDPDAVMVTGITPQKTLSEGLSEPEFLRVFNKTIAAPDTIFVGFNSIRFDDEFMRYLHYRNFYDPYEWHWKDGRSRWDLLDLTRMTRALRPDGIKWPVDTAGRPTNRLEMLTAANKLDHQSAHDALSDVTASIAFARLIRNKQPKLFDYLLSLRDKNTVSKLVETGQPFVYSSGKYDSDIEKTTVAVKLTDHPEGQAALVYDLRHDPHQFIGKSPLELAEAWRRRSDEPGLRLPVKTLKFNRCPAVAPLSVLDEKSLERLKLDMKTVNRNLNRLKKSDLASAVIEALRLLDKQQADLLPVDASVDSRLYDGFFVDSDKPKMSMVRAADEATLKTLNITFADTRLQALIPLYKGRHFPVALQPHEREIWEKFKAQQLLSGGTTSRLASYFKRLEALSKDKSLSAERRYWLEELQLYGQNIAPLEDF